MSALDERNDPFEVIGDVPESLAYQWVPLRIMGNAEVAQPYIDTAKAAGWMPVPSKRHPRMPHVKEWIIVQDQLLVQRSKSDDDERHRREIAVAHEQDRSIKEALGFYSYNRGTDGRSYHLATEWLHGRRESERFVRLDLTQARESLRRRGETDYVEVVIGLKVTPRDFDAAFNVCNLMPAEYMKRRVWMGVEVLQIVAGDCREPSAGPPIFEPAAMFVRPEQNPSR